ncbi:MAG: ribonuclease HII [Lachnospiraceae bacterium]|nr:ribonuclease HII [Lachnospiraceae bacterium]MBQ7261753.1 ribonuclease HII [Lachnospiraceae bacterium]
MTKAEREEKARLKLEAERERLYLMSEYERKFADAEYICGVDEVGRGPFAGPVMAGAVILPKDCEILYLNDSKKLSYKKREALFDEIREKAVSYFVARVEPSRIDEINILQATYEAMREAINNLSVRPDIILVDAVNIPGIDIRQESIIKGDAKSVSIAAASIIAKVTRDRVMEEYAKEYPGYGFERNMGYGTAEHRAALKEKGATPIHRRSFIHNYI